MLANLVWCLQTLVPPVLLILCTLLWLWARRTHRRLLQALEVADAASARSRQETAPVSSAASTRVSCGTLREVPFAASVDAKHAWSTVGWEDIRLRCGPNYKRNKRKKPTAEPLLPCVGVDVFCAPRKLFSDGATGLACLPAEIRAATAGSAPLPRFLVVSVHMPNYASGAADGPNIRYTCYLVVPPELRSDSSAAASMLCEFLDGAGSGHTDAAGRFYDRFKVVAMLRGLDLPTGFFLRTMIDSFNGKPMLWRFYGKWGNCSREGDVVFVNLDMCTGGMLKNSTFAEGVRGAYFEHSLFDIAWTLEARTDEEMPERLLGGARIVRPQLTTVGSGLPTRAAPEGATRDADAALPVSSDRQPPSLADSSATRRPSRGAVMAGTGMAAAAAAAASPAVACEKPPAVLTKFLSARRLGDAATAASCCTEDIACCRLGGKMVVGRETLRRGLFTRPTRHFSQPLRLLARRGGVTRWGREVTVPAMANGGQPSSAERFRQEFSVVDLAGVPSQLRICKIELVSL